MSHIEGQTNAYWNERFKSGDWSENGGNFQSLLFMNTILDIAFQKFPVLREYARTGTEPDGTISFYPTKIVDFGSAEGDGTAVIQSRFPLAQVVGVDWSFDAIQKARLRWPTLSFRVGDIENPTGTADIIFTSHTLEHLTDPAETVNRLLDVCSWLIVAVPPISTDEKGGHDGAVPYAEWKAKTKPLSEVGKNTVRMVGGDPWAEGTCILIYRGRLDLGTTFDSKESTS
jgi:hypothetical protein